ncbi:hypothetical protein [Pseudomonas oryzihabitans]|uniref:hypothetical protein n=1 Tax=Pseudomonas oryzihabitans TaxID=47885 RepID=UPI00119E8840|nr:hypothetical protein [Pseudomonas psychrotolerans]
MDDLESFQLRYVGARFNKARLPVDVLSDLPAFRDLLVAYAKDEWHRQNQQYKRVPKGFDKSLDFDLTAIEEGSAIPKIDWNKSTAQETLPGLADQLQSIVSKSYSDIVRLIDDAANDVFPNSLSYEHIKALNKFGARLRPGERIEFLNSKDANGQVIFFDINRRKELITRVRETYEAGFEGLGTLIGCIADERTSSILVRTEKHGDITIPLDTKRVIEDFDGSIGSEVQFDLSIELDHSDKLRNVIAVKDIELIETMSDAQQKLASRLRYISDFKDGWMDGAGAAASSRAVSSCRELFRKTKDLAERYRLYPSEEGSLLVEFETNDWEYFIRIEVDGRISLSGLSLDGEDEIDTEHYPSANDDFLAILDSRTKTEHD